MAGIREKNKVIPSKVTDAPWVYSVNYEDKSDFHYDASADSATERKDVDQTISDTSVNDVVKKFQEVVIGEQPVVQEIYTGKWMMFLDQVEEDDKGYTQHDRVWFKMAQLCRNGRLWKAKASTAIKHPTALSNNLGSICCYTQDYRNMEEVVEKADLIRNTAEEELEKTVIYYKTDMATLAKRYRILIPASERVSIYRHKPDYSFWKIRENLTSVTKGFWDVKRTNRRFNKRLS